MDTVAPPSASTASALARRHHVGRFLQRFEVRDRDHGRHRACDEGRDAFPGPVDVVGEARRVLTGASRSWAISEGVA